MSTVTPHHVFLYEEYLARERETGFKHEFLRGQVFAMAGGSPERARLIAEVAFALRGMIDPAKCRVFTSELKIRIEATGLATYPDVAVVCGDVVRDGEDKNALTNPKILVEVLSPSTEAYDRGEKWAHYRRIATLDAYVLVSQIPERLDVRATSRRRARPPHRRTGRGIEARLSRRNARSRSPLSGRAVDGGGSQRGSPHGGRHFDLAARQ